MKIISNHTPIVIDPFSKVAIELKKKKKDKKCCEKFKKKKGKFCKECPCNWA
ncbi:MAG: hypothetical protein KDD24_09870 [Flavobacteriales bacterium]|nr:hypothetical protein [Flavobacteriales bacterium]MCB9174843.1 hypothetical protein [Flavobacteriales bacterium]